MGKGFLSMLMKQCSIFSCWCWCSQRQTKNTATWSISFPSSMYLDHFNFCLGSRTWWHYCSVFIMDCGCFFFFLVCVQWWMDILLFLWSFTMYRFCAKLKTSKLCVVKNFHKIGLYVSHIIVDWWLMVRTVFPLLFLFHVGIWRLSCYQQQSVSIIVCVIKYFSVLFHKEGSWDLLLWWFFIGTHFLSPATIICTSTFIWLGTFFLK